MLHSEPKSNDLTRAEAAPVAEAAHYEKEHGSDAIGNILARRAKAGKLVAGVAAATHSDMFKGPVRYRTQISSGKYTNEIFIARWKTHGKAMGP